MGKATPSDAVPRQASKQVRTMPGGRELVLFVSVSQAVNALPSPSPMPALTPSRSCQVCRVCLWKVCIATFEVLLTSRNSSKYGTDGTMELANG
ncbi:hypothetical protein DHEL01_v203638 [Diaporthe helianthi]|uniref:Uncharacterized protein n=1 Tax=Diaporthe helianthi TaxID=158607 RepID=A0A2P5I647_DIAHE|nr:hypothetical protein DHEL01_v203638 [Diaporthe helianthi]